MGGCSLCRVGLGNPYSTRGLNRPASFLYGAQPPCLISIFGEGIDTLECFGIEMTTHVGALQSTRCHMDRCSAVSTHSKSHNGCAGNGNLA
jgi:hypothetical protein